MIHRLLPTLRACCTLVTALLAGFPAAAQAASADFPSRPVRIIVPWPPGGSTDTLARIIGQRLTTLLGQPVVIENRPGVSGVIGLDAAAKSTADGHTLSIAELSHAILSYTNARMPFDLGRDFTPISMIGVSPLVLFVNSQVTAKTVKELLALAHAKPGTLAMAHIGTGSVGHLTGELIRQRTGANFNLIGYKGAAPALIELAGGQVQAYFATVASGAGTLKTGRIFAMAVAAPKRLATMPDVPTLEESGLTDLNVSQWWGLLAPAGLPKAAFDRIHRDAVTAIGHPSVRERVAELAVEPTPGSPQELSRFMAAEVARWARAARDAGLKPE